MENSDLVAIDSRDGEPLYLQGIMRMTVVHISSRFIIENCRSDAGTSVPRTWRNSHLAWMKILQLSILSALVIIVQRSNLVTPFESPASRAGRCWCIIVRWRLTVRLGPGMIFVRNRAFRDDLYRRLAFEALMVGNMDAVGWKEVRCDIWARDYPI
jgi:hypothetical protein